MAKAAKPCSFRGKKVKLNNLTQVPERGSNIQNMVLKQSSSRIATLLFLMLGTTKRQNYFGRCYGLYGQVFASFDWHYR